MPGVWIKGKYGGRNLVFMGCAGIGDIAGKGSIAIDDKNGPLRMGQMVFIEGYGIGKCNDRGSAIKKWRIYLCFDTIEEAQEMIDHLKAGKPY